MLTLLIDWPFPRSKYGLTRSHGSRSNSRMAYWGRELPSSWGSVMTAVTKTNLPLGMPSHTQRRRQERERGGCVAAVWVVEVIALIGLRPVLQHWHQPARCHMVFHHGFGQPGQAEPGQRGAEHRRQAVEDERAVAADALALPAFLKVYRNSSPCVGSRRLMPAWAVRSRAGAGTTGAGLQKAPRHGRLKRVCARGGAGMLALHASPTPLLDRWRFAGLRLVVTRSVVTMDFGQPVLCQRTTRLSKCPWKVQRVASRPAIFSLKICRSPSRDVPAQYRLGAPWWLAGGLTIFSP